MSPLTPEQLLLVKPAIDLAKTTLKPLAQKVWNWSGQMTERLQFELFDSFQTYLTNSYQRHSYFTTLVFKNEQKKLDDYYLPLTLLKHPDSKPHKVNSFPDTLLSQYRKLLVVDTAGMGKSTILKFLFLSCVRENAGIPILIELRKLSKTKKILDVIVENTANIAGDTKQDLIVHLINTGRFVFLFDGYDEISESDRPDVARNICEFVAAASNNWYVMTSREESSLSAFPDFQRFTIKPLEIQEAYRLIRLYDQSGQYADALIAKLEEAGKTNVQEFLTNPLLTSLLFKSFEFKRTIPMRMHIFYRQVFEALFETHDLMKEEYQREKRSGLDIDQFDQLLRYFCFLTYRDGKTTYSKDEFLSYIEQAKRLTANKTTISSNVVYDLTHGVPLMVEEGNYFRWVHRSMQEYFAALWICRDSKEKQRNYLTQMYKDTSLKHQNLIILCADIDPIEFRRTVVKELAIYLRNEFNSLYGKEFETFSTENIQKRKELVTGKMPFIFNEKQPVSSSKSSPNIAPEQAHRLTIAMSNYCKSKNIEFAGASWHGFGSAGVGFITRHDTAMLNLPQFRNLIPFIKSLPSHANPHQLRTLDLPVLPFTVIDDDPNNAVNKKDYFEKLNVWLTATVGWYFDEKLAIETLRQIEIEENESNALKL